MNNKNIEFKLLDQKTDQEDVVLECSAYLKTKQFMADRIYQQQEEIQILKQQIFSISSTNSQLGRFIENFEKETFNLKDKLSQKEKYTFNCGKENLNPNYFNAGINHNLVSKGDFVIKSSKKNKNADENNKFNLSDDDTLMKSEVLQAGYEENKNESFSDFEQMNYNLIETSQNSEDSHNTIDNNEDIMCSKNFKNENFENGSIAQNKNYQKFKEFINENNKNKNKNKFENLKISDSKEINANFFGNNPIKNYNNCSLNKNLNCNNIISNNNFTCNNIANNNLNLSFHNYNFQINNERKLEDKIQKLNNEIIEKTIDNNKLRTDKFIIMSELNEILTSLTRIDLDKLNEFYLDNISKHNLSKYLMPTAKGIKYNILSCQNNLAKIIKSDLMKNYDIENLYSKTFIDNFNNNDKHYSKNYFANNNKNNNQHYSNYKTNNQISPIKNPNKLLNEEENLIISSKNNDCNDLTDFNKKKIKNVLENNFNMNVNGLYDLFSKHEGEFEALLEKKLMKLNRDEIKNNPNNNYHPPVNNNYNKNNLINNKNPFCNTFTNSYGISRISNPSHFSTQETYSP